jgi:uncharacterized protein YdiU (UPF0061 family)
VSLEFLKFNNTFAKLGEEFFTKVSPKGLSDPYVVDINMAGLNMLGIPSNQIDTKAEIPLWLMGLCSGNELPKGCDPLAMVYSGHQFGGYSPELGDGRGMLIGEAEGPLGKWDIHLKGAGKTPYSRFGDGRSVLRSTIREYLCSEAMHALGINTTRALSIFSNEEPVYRERIERAALLVRIARSHIRFGSFEYFHHTRQYKSVKKLADYTIIQYFPIFKEKHDRYLQMFRNIVHKTAEMIAKWQSVGFSHGVMNTDNMSILGETLDYGPFGFMDSYNPNFICNHSDRYGRYSFKNQPNIGLWNCNALATALTSLLDSGQLKLVLDEYQTVFLNTLLKLYRQKLGLENTAENDQNLIDELLRILEVNKIDYTIFFRRLCFFKSKGNHKHLKELSINQNALDGWIKKYQDRLLAEPKNEEERKNKMIQHNPKYILRNYMAEIAIQKAEDNKDYTEISRILKLLQSPYNENPECEDYAKHPPEWSKKITVSCSS